MLNVLPKRNLDESTTNYISFATNFVQTLTIISDLSLRTE